jgi:hypothetical protein
MACIRDGRKAQSRARKASRPAQVEYAEAAVDALAAREQMPTMMILSARIGSTRR